MLMLNVLCLVTVCLVYVHGGIFSIKSIGYDYDYTGGKGGGGGGGGKGGGDTTVKRIAGEYYYYEPKGIIAYSQPYDQEYYKPQGIIAYSQPYDQEYYEPKGIIAYSQPYDQDYPGEETTTVAPKVTTAAPQKTEPPTVTVAPTGTGVTPTETGVTLTTTPVSIYDQPLNFYQFNCFTNEPLWNIPKPPTRFEMTRKLYADLLTGYDTRVRPIQNQSQPIYVNTKFVPLTLIEFDTFQQRFSLLAYIRIRWYDELMMWRPKYYMCMSSLKVSTTGLWTPNIVIHKSFDENNGVGNVDTDILMVGWNGNIQWVPEATYSVVCDVNIQYFPFDEQTCTMTYYAADESITSLELDHYLGVDMSEYTENPSWKVVAATRKRYIKDNNWYVDIQFKLQRRANFALFTLVAPLVMLAFLNISVFLVPINSGEKGSFSITIFLSYGIFFTVVSDTLPQNSLQISYFVLFISILLCLSVVSVFYTVLQAKLVATLGHKKCPITCLRKTRTFQNRVAPIDHYIETGVTEDDDEYTWEQFLSQLDTYFFVTFLLALFLISGIFFAILARHISDAAPSFDEDPLTTIRTPPKTTIA